MPGRGWLVSAGWCVWDGVTFVSWVWVCRYVYFKKFQRSWSSFLVLTWISCTFLTESLIRNSPFKVGAECLSWGNMHLMCSCWVRFSVLCHTGGLSGSLGQTLPAWRCASLWTNLHLASWCPTYSAWLLCPNEASGSASQLWQAGVSLVYPHKRLVEGSSLLGALVLFDVRACNDAVFQEGKLASVPLWWCSTTIPGHFPSLVCSSCLVKALPCSPSLWSSCVFVSSFIFTLPCMLGKCCLFFPFWRWKSEAEEQMGPRKNL